MKSFESYITITVTNLPITLVVVVRCSREKSVDWVETELRFGLAIVATAYYG